MLGKGLAKMQFPWREAAARRFAALLLASFVMPARSAFAQKALSFPKGSGAAEAVDGHYGHENWNSLSLADSRMRADEPLLGAKDEETEFTRELFRAQWRDGDPIDLYVIRPSHLEKPPVVLYLYSYPSDTHRFLDNAYCQRVTRDGFAAVGFVSALTGQRYHGRPMKQWFVSELQESLVLSVHDVQMVLNYLARRGDLDLGSLGMFGAGSGGTIAILAAAVDKRIKTVDLLDPWGDWPDWVAKSSLIPEAERPQYLNPQFLKRVAPFDPVEWLPQLKSQTIRLQHVMDDSVTPLAAKRRIEAVAPHAVQLVRYDDSPALFKATAGGALFNWIKQQLRPAARINGSVATTGRGGSPSVH
jgi:hypothetical protein